MGKVKFNLEYSDNNTAKMGNIIIGSPYTKQAVFDLTRAGIMAGEVITIRDTLDGLCHKDTLGPVNGLYDLRALSIMPLFKVSDAMAVLTGYSIDTIRVRVGDRMENKLVIGMNFSLKPMYKGRGMLNVAYLLEAAKAAVYGEVYGGEFRQCGIINKLLDACPKLKFGGFDKRPFYGPDVIILGEKRSDLYIWSHDVPIKFCDVDPNRCPEPKLDDQDINKELEARRVGPGLYMGSNGWKLRHALWQYLRKTGYEFACFVEEK